MKLRGISKPTPSFAPVSTVSDAFAQWEAESNDRFTKLKTNEEELNRIFIEIYGLQNELTPEVDDKDVTSIESLIPKRTFRKA